MATDIVATATTDDLRLADELRSQPREQVPSQRERDAGGADGIDSPRILQRAVQRTTMGDRGRAYLKSIDPRLAFRTSKHGARPVLVFAAVGLFVGFEGQVASLFAPDVQATFNYPLGVIGGLIVLSGLAGLVLAPIIGWMIDRYNRVWFLRIGTLIGQVGLLLMPFGSTAGRYGTSLLLQNVGGTVASPTVFPLMSDYYPPSARVRVFAFQGAVGLASSVVGLAVAFGLAVFFGWRPALVVCGLVGIVASLLYFMLREPVRGEQDRLAMGQSEAVAARAQQPVSLREGFRACVAVQTQRRLWYATPFIALTASAVYAIYPYYLSSVYQASATLRIVLALVAVPPGILAAVIAAPVADRLMARRPGRVLAVNAGISALVSVYAAVLALAPPLPVVVIASLIPGFIGGIVGPASLAVTSLVVPARVRGMSFQLGGLVGRVSGLVIIGALFAFAGANGFQATLLLFGGLGLIGALLTWYASFGVERDIRAAFAVTAADEETRKAREAGAAKLVVCRDVDVTYDGVQVLFNVDFDVAEGECVALLGTNGAGKSTLLRAIAGTQEASNGAIFFDGVDITHSPPHMNAERGIVMIPGGRAVFPSMSVDENLRAAGWLRRDDPGGYEAALARVREWFPVLVERHDQLAGTLSGGEQQMLSLAQAFLMTPRLLLIDELSLGLAPQVIEKLLGIVREITAAGTTVVLVEQSINLALTIATRAVFMEKGEVRFDGPVDDLVARPDILRSVFLGQAEIKSSLGSMTTRSADSDATAALRVEHVTVEYGGVRALADVSIEIGAGEILGVIGPNGAGKSTLSDVISGYIPAGALTGGAVLLGTRDVTTLTPDARARAGISRSFQNVRLFPQMTVAENIAVALEKRIRVRSALLSAVWAPQVRADEKRVARRVDNLIGALGLGAYRDKFVSELSTGSRRIVDIACQLAAQPQVLLLDEPSSGLAQAEAEELGPVMVRINRELGCAILLIEHDVPLLRSVSHRLVAMELGRVVTTGEPGAVLTDPRVTRSYLGSTEAINARSGARPPVPTP
ncbi:MAG: MFS transporter [Candidatus Dormibacteria bacterium]